MGNAARMPWCGTAGKAGDGEIEASPEQMDGAALADKAAAENLEHPLNLQQRTPIGPGCVAVISPQRPVFWKGDALGQFAGHRLNCDVKAKCLGRRYHGRIKTRARLRR